MMLYVMYVLYPLVVLIGFFGFYFLVEGCPQEIRWGGRVLAAMIAFLTLLLVYNNYNYDEIVSSTPQKELFRIKEKEREKERKKRYLNKTIKLCKEKDISGNPWLEIQCEEILKQGRISEGTEPLISLSKLRGN